MINPKRLWFDSASSPTLEDLTMNLESHLSYSPSAWIKPLNNWGQAMFEIGRNFLQDQRQTTHLCFLQPKEGFKKRPVLTLSIF